MAPGTAGCSGAGSYTVSTDNPSDKILIQDDESTTVSLTSSDPTMSEGDASNPATLTVTLSRRLYAGEIIAAPIVLATSTGARLPNHATPDFTVSASGTGVSLVNATGTTPRVVFTGHDSNTVQTATVTLTPVANRNDGDAMHETITAELTSLGVTGLETTVSGGVAEHSSDSAATLTIDDDEAVCTTQSTVLSVSDIRMSENGGETTYCVLLTTAPSGGDTTVTIGMAAGVRVFDPSAYTVIESVSSGAATLSTTTLTFTAANYTVPQPVTITAVDEAGTHRNRRFNLTHTASGGGYSSQALGTVPVLVNDAPELEVFEYRYTWDDAAYKQYQRRSGWSLHRPNTITSTPGILASNDIIPGWSLDYYVRLSSQPDGDVTVTLNVTDIPGYDASTFTGISFSPTGAPQQTLTFTFTDANPNPGCGHHTIGRDRYFVNSNPSRLGLSETYDPNKTRISWKCYKAVYAFNTRGGSIFDQEGTMCADVVHTATGGGLRSVTVDTLRIHNLGRVYANQPKAFYRNLNVYYTGWVTVRPPVVTYDPDTGERHKDYTNATEFKTITIKNIPLYRDQDTNEFYKLVNLERGTRKWRMQKVPSSFFNSNGVWTPSGPVVSIDTLNLETEYRSTGRFHSPANCYYLGRAEERRLKSGQSSPQNSPLPAQAAPAPTTAVENLSVVAGSGSSVTVTWDAVEHATKYNVDYSADGGGDSLAQSAGNFDDITATSLTFDHGLSSLDTLTVTVTPGYDSDEMGGTVYLNSLAATATLSPGSSSAAECTPNLPNDAVTLADVTGWRDASPNDTAHVLRWNRVLAALGVDTGETPMTIAESIVNESALNAARWDRVTRTLQALAQCSEATEPEISIAVGAEVTEGSDATFTITAIPAPTAALTVSVTVSQSGAYTSSTGAQTITIPTTGTYTLTVSTTDDSTDEADGSVTATVDTGTGYTVSSNAGAATVAVSDDDEYVWTPQATGCVSESLVTLVRSYYNANKNNAPTYGENWKRVLIAFGDVEDDSLKPFTVAEAWQGEQKWLGWNPIRKALTCLRNFDYDSPPPPSSTPEISIAAGSDVTEGTDATFTLTANPTPASVLDVTVEVSQSGDYGAITGSQTVTIPASGSYTLTVATTGDSADEADGSVTATLNTGTGYTVSATAGAATVAVSDDDDPPPATPEISIASSGDITEGSDATFTVTASPAPTAGLTVSVSVSQSGDFGVTTGAQTVTIPASGSYTLTVATSGDSADDADGSVTATVNTGTGYTVSATASAATVAVSDDDDPSPATPEISIAAGSGVTEGNSATFTITASPTPQAALPVSVSVTQSGDYGVITGARTVTIPASGSYTLTVATGNDSADEADGSVTATVDSGNGYTVSTSNGAATVAVSDDDVPEISIAAGAGVTEGSNASFTITANPTPASALGVSLTVSQYGDYGATTGVQTVTIPATGTYTLAVATTGDSDDEADGSVTATLNTGTGYTVSATASAATVAVSDDDDTPVTCNLPEDAITVAEVTGWRDALDANKAAAGIKRWNRVLATFGEDTGHTPMTAEQARQVADWLGNTRWDRTARTLEAMEQCDNPPPATPEISISAGSGVTEGSNASFTLTASPAPTAALPVSVSVTQSGDFGVSTGAQTVTIPTGGSYTLTVATNGDSDGRSGRLGNGDPEHWHRLHRIGNGQCGYRGGVR